MARTSIAAIIEQIEEQQVKREIERYKDEIEGFRRWHSEESRCRIIANIRCLNRMGVSKIDLSFCFLENARLENANLEDSDLGGANLRGANLNKANLQFVWLGKSVLSNATLAAADLGQQKSFPFSTSLFTSTAKWSTNELLFVDGRSGSFNQVKTLPAIRFSLTECEKYSNLNR